MRRLFYVTHANVCQDPEVPVPDWGLSPEGQARHDAFCAFCPPVGSVFCSFERKACEGAASLANARGLTARQVLSLHEIDRSATGFLDNQAFDANRQAFFRYPRQRARGWERAIDAQARVVATLKRVVAEAPPGDIAVIAHGTIGALLRAHVLGAPIDISHDQPLGGGGHVMVLSLPDFRMLSDWQRIEAFNPGDMAWSG